MTAGGPFRHNAPIFSKQKKKRRRIDRTMIGEPMNFVHLTHIGSGEMGAGDGLAMVIRGCLRWGCGLELFLFESSSRGHNRILDGEVRSEDSRSGHQLHKPGTLAFQVSGLGSLIFIVNRLLLIGVGDIYVFKSYLAGFFQKPYPFLLFIKNCCLSAIVSHIVVGSVGAGKRPSTSVLNNI